jgi:amino acid adenylation domain-containing protein
MQSEVRMTGWKTLLHAEGVARRIPLLSMRVEEARCSTRAAVIGRDNEGDQRPDDVGLTHMLLRHVQRDPDGVAIVFGNDRLSYREFAEGSIHIAAYLQHLGCAVDDCIGLFVEPSIEQMLCAWGVLFAGSAYLALSLDYPEERLQYMMEDAQVGIVFTQLKFRERLEALAPAGTHIVTVEDVAAFMLAKETAIEPSTVAGNVRPQHLAYVIYTSGSTGKPKGVMIEHRSIVNQMCWLSETRVLGPGKKLIHKTPISFDAAQWEILSPSCGCTVVVGEPGIHRSVEDLIDAIVRYDVTTLQCVPTLLQALLDSGRFSSCRSLRQILSGAESLSKKLALQCLNALPQCELINMYGPAECTINASAVTVTRDLIQKSANGISIGHPVRDTAFHILDEAHSPTFPGEVGELYVSGVQLARGYLNLPELTARSFFNQPSLSARHGTRIYRTGDLAYWNTDGSAQFVGRKDSQVKIRGMRVELEEIKLALETLGPVMGAAVLTNANRHTGALQLVACIELNAEAAQVASGQPAGEIATSLRKALSDTLPDYMVPSEFLIVDKLPLTTSGKIDFKALMAWSALNQERPIVAPRTETEKRVCEIWTVVMKRADVSIEDDFFAYGGDSLVAVGLIQEINATFGTSLPLHALFTAPTIEKLARLVDGGGADESSRLIRLKARGTLSPVFCWPGLGGYPMNLRALAGKISIDRPFYGIQAYGISEGEEPYPTIEAMAEGDIAEIKRLQPHGPYTLWGYSFGAGIAFEAAYQLERRGERVENLFLIAPGCAQIKVERQSIDDGNHVYNNRELVALLFSVFSRGAADADLAECLAAAHDEGSFAAFIRTKQAGLAIDQIKRIAGIVVRTFALNYTDDEVRARVVDAPITIFNARDDGPSFIERCEDYPATPVVHRLDTTHFEVLRPPHLDQLVGLIHQRHAA